MKTFIPGLLATTGLAVLAFNSAHAQIKTVAPDTLSAIVGKTCRGYYKQSEGGTGSLQRPESAFLAKSISRDGSFTLTAAWAKPGASDGWETNGNSYNPYRTSGFKLQSDGSLVFDNVNGFSSYRLTPVAGKPLGTEFTVVYSHSSGTAVGKARCS